ncbi:MAG: hypothetical protein KAI76_03140, partial [Alphaproteobacteria bacterium]|nr:hypothetical protein [Alphaproteobacteria bacterium]
KRDPFNPHAIARLRQNAYQKTIVMHYIDNLIDWADNLFAHDTRESITEASMLYIMVLDILGKRPVQVGECKTAENMNYEKLADEIDGDSEFLISLEHVYINTKNTYEFSIKPQRATKVLDAILSRTKAIGKKSTLDDIRITAFSRTFDDKMENAKTVLADDDETIVKLRNGNTMTAREAVADNHLAFAPKYGMKTLRNTDSNYRVMSYNNAYYNKFSMVDMVSKNLGLSRSGLNDRIRYKPSQRFPDFEIVRQSVTAFCVPNNKNLLQYWDRVEDQLFKIRHCMNIHGIRRSLALFQPPIDPMMLVKAKAAGLSLEDISALLADSAEIPPYRFVSILKSAKQITQMAQSFGKSLLSALEKKDTEELRLLHSTHKRNILRMTKGIKKRQIREAKYKAESLRQTLLKAEDGEDYYKSLIEAGLTNWEIVEQASTHVATGFKTAEGVTHLMAGISFLVPQIGSPFSMKYGGKELGDSATEFAKWSSSMASVASQIAGSARLEAKFQRRTQDWRYKLQLAKKAVVQAEQQLLAADIKVAILEKELEIHERNIEQSQELEDFYKNKFTNLGLYNYLSSTLNRLYREAYNIAYDLAKMAERTYQFETNSTDFFIANDNWEYTKAGLLAGDKLQVQLATIEKSFLQNNTRRPEITQSFSLSMLNGGELLKLQQTGSCNIVIPEMAFDTLYPGQYRRLIKAVKVTVPCVVGTYTNISAKLTLLGSSVEFEDKAMLSESFLGKNTAITTSSGVNDSGMFEFNFKDERHLPFEGAGAISEWNLSLPSKIRSFNYNTISDVIIQISYTALDGDREFSENALVDMITNHAATHGMYRLLSLKHEFPESFHELINPAEGQPQSADLDITVLHFPYLFNGKDITISEAKIYLKPISGEEISTPANATLNGANISWTASEDIALPGESANIGKIKGGTVSLSGNAIKTWTVNTGIDGLNDSTLEDVLILVKYMVDI